MTHRPRRDIPPAWGPGPRTATRSERQRGMAWRPLNRVPSQASFITGEQRGWQGRPSPHSPPCVGAGRAGTWPSVLPRAAVGLPGLLPPFLLASNLQSSRVHGRPGPWTFPLHGACVHRPPGLSSAVLTERGPLPVAWSPSALGGGAALPSEGETGPQVPVTELKGVDAKCISGSRLRPAGAPAGPPSARPGLGTCPPGRRLASPNKGLCVSVRASRLAREQPGPFIPGAT